jgi:hypothetical protein
VVGSKDEYDRLIDHKKYETVEEEE